MKNQRSIALFLVSQAVFIFAAYGSAAAQTKVAIIDIGAVFKGHAQFTQALDTLRVEAEQFKTNSIQLQQQLVQKAEALKQYEQGSADFKTAESQLAQESAAMEVEQRDKMRQLMKREAQLHFDTYAQVNQLLNDYCDSQGIQLVLRFNGEPMDPANPGSIMQRVNGSIIFNQPDRDITQQIIAMLAEGSRNAAAGNNVLQR